MMTLKPDLHDRIQTGLNAAGIPGRSLVVVNHAGLSDPALEIPV